ncbi:hypothetical protein [Teredinibacter haidensis]|uniref:hypothetical protein n=1 Tax=Teredinibacter haidensis TaxID=2731755 RepID=UPI0009490A60|nr:hypothetical protein [Teredinibacter haidensis]
MNIKLLFIRFLAGVLGTFMIFSGCYLALSDVPKGFFEWSGYLGGLMLGIVFLVYAYKGKNMLGKEK